MGQAQMLLLVVGVVVVVLAIYVGLTFYAESAVQANRDAVITELQLIAADAQKFYRKPSNIGGGGRAFTGYAIPQRLRTTANGTYTVTSTRAQQIQIRGQGFEKNELGQTIRHRATITLTTVTITKLR